MMQNETDLVGIEVADVETRTKYAVTAGHEERDPRRSVFVVETVTFVHSAKRGLWWIKTEGHKVKNGHMTQGGYSVDLTTGQIEPDRRSGPAPAWLVNLLANYRENREPMRFFAAAHVPAGSDRFA
jgi:hypothetical protein